MLKPLPLWINIVIGSCYRLWSHVCRSLLLLCSISSGNESCLWRLVEILSHLLSYQLIYWWNWWWFVCRLHFYFLFCRAYCWVIWVKLHTLWNTMPMLAKPFFLLFQVGVSMFACFTMAHLHTSHQLRCNAILYLQVVHSGQLFSSPTLLH